MGNAVEKSSEWSGIEDEANGNDKEMQKKVFPNTFPLFSTSPTRKRTRYRNDGGVNEPDQSFDQLSNQAGNGVLLNESATDQSTIKKSDLTSKIRNYDLVTNRSIAQASTVHASITQNSIVDKSLVQEPDNSSDEIFQSTTGKKSAVEFMDERPIMKAVISRGLKARFKSISAWLLNEPTKASMSGSTSVPVGLGDSLKRWSSLRSSFNFGSKSRRESSLKGRALKREGIRQTSATSLNSLPDGRTPWPVPWLEAIFQPEFPSKGQWNESSFKILGTIAKGAFGKVYRVAAKSNPDQLFAMKVQDKSDVITQNAIQQIKDEVSIHMNFSNYPFIAQLRCSWQSRSKLYIVIQYIAGYGDLYQLWKDEGPFNEDATKIWAAELATAIDYMHSTGVIYRDLKMENIMLDDDGHIQLVDFGLAKWLQYGDRTSTICGTLQYMAPEILLGDPYNHSIDWWSLGVLLHTLMVGSYPFSGSDNHVTTKIDDYIPSNTLTTDAQNLLTKLLTKDPNWRLRSYSLYKGEPFFRGISFDAIRNKTMHPFDYIPRMRRCNTCNTVNEDSEGLEDCDLAIFQEEYEALRSFDSLCE